jgi:hypothetical protein
MSTSRTSLPLALIGLAHQLIVPDVAFPGADDDPLAGNAVLELELVLVLLVVLLLQPDTASAPTRPGRAASCQLVTERLAAYLRDLAPPPPHVVER